MSSNVLVDRDINATVTAAPENTDGKVDVKSMEYHRQVLQSKIDQQQFVFPPLFDGTCANQFQPEASNLTSLLPTPS